MGLQLLLVVLVAVVGLGRSVVVGSPVVVVVGALVPKTTGALMWATAMRPVDTACNMSTEISASKLSSSSSGNLVEEEDSTARRTSRANAALAMAITHSTTTDPGEMVRLTSSGSMPMPAAEATACFTVALKAP